MGTYLIDNRNNRAGNISDYETVYSFLEDNIIKENVEGKLYIVTGYTTIGMLSKIFNELEEKSNSKIKEYKIILGDLDSVSNKKQKNLKILKDIQSVLELPETTQNACKFLELDKVKFKTLDPEFCHGKVYIFEESNTEVKYPKNFLIIGSSNFTEKGLGYYKVFDSNKKASNFEVNIAFDAIANHKNNMNSSEFKHSLEWFNELWDREECNKTKQVEVIDENGKIILVEKTINQILIDQIKKNYIEPKTPKEVYLKILHELFSNNNVQNEISERSLGKLENSKVYKNLYKFQKQGVLSLIQILKKYNCAILGDAVGLGKTWSALSVMKFFEIEGYEIILLVPKRLRNNWEQYVHSDSNKTPKFKEDKFNFVIRNHTDLNHELIDNGDGKNLENYFCNNKKKLLVIDESHNLRNKDSKKYKFLLDNILKKNQDIKVLMLSATPINTNLMDICNQIFLGVKGNNFTFIDEFGINNLSEYFNQVSKSYEKWLEEKNNDISKLRTSLPESFLEITKKLIVARTRDMIKKILNEDDIGNLKFIESVNKEIIKSPIENIGNLKNFDDIEKSLPEYFAAYKPFAYLNIKEDKKIKSKSDTSSKAKREKFLVKMLKMLLVNRLESSWKSFYNTLLKMLDYHSNLLDLILKVENGFEINIPKKSKQLSILDSDISDIESKVDSEDDSFIDNIKIETIETIIDIKNNGNLLKYKTDVLEDIDSLKLLKQNLEELEKLTSNEKNKENHLKSSDSKLYKLINIINEKQKKDNKKIIIFTAYKDTADYLFDQLVSKGYINVAKVTGSDSRTSDNPNIAFKNFEPILERFAPYTKLFLAKDYDGFDKDLDISLQENYSNWKDFIKNNLDYSSVKEKIENPIEILIATDCLSEGQNLQDSDMVINYDIHWNPVRLIQRIGRIDRLGSPNNTIYIKSFLPADNVEGYLNITKKVEERMLSMTFAGSEADIEIVGSSKNSKDLELEKIQEERFKREMQITLGEIDQTEQTQEDSSQMSLFSSENYKNELYNELSKKIEEEKDIPDGIYSGFELENKEFSGLIVLLRKKHYKKSKKLSTNYLLYLDKNGKYIKINNVDIKDKNYILKFLSENKNRNTSSYIKNIDSSAILSFSDTIKSFIKGDFKNSFMEEFFEKQGLGLFNELEFNEDDFKEPFDKFELVCWMSVN